MTSKSRGGANEVEVLNHFGDEVLKVFSLEP